METLLIENAHLRMRVNPQGGGLQELFSLTCGQPVLWDGGDSALFPMVPLANRVAGNRFRFQGREVVLPQSPVDERFFLHGDGWLAVALADSFAFRHGVRPHLAQPASVRF